MPGFIGVRWGEMVPIPPETVFPDIYLRLGPTSIETPQEALVERTAPDDLDVVFLWSFTSVKEVHALVDAPGGGYRHYVSADGAKTWGSTSIPMTTEVRLAMGPDALYGWADAGPLRQTDTGGQTWFDIVPLPAGGVTINKLIASQSNLYIEVAMEAAPNFYYSARDGSGLTKFVDYLDDGAAQLVGQCAMDAVIVWEGTNNELLTTGTPPKRFVGGGGVELDLPPVFTSGVPPFDFRTYAACQFHDQTAILASIQQVSGEYTVHVHRSTNEGLTWAEVDTYAVAFASKFQTFDVVYNGETQGTWWHNLGSEVGSLGLKHSIDDGLTWTYTLGALDVPPSIFSAGRPTSHMA